MGLEVPSWAGEMFHVVTGDGWPAVDEDQIHDLGRLWLQLGAQLAEYAPAVTRAAQDVAGAGVLYPHP